MLSKYAPAQVDLQSVQSSRKKSIRDLDDAIHIPQVKQKQNVQIENNFILII
jgi:hypothetical protein